MRPSWLAVPTMVLLLSPLHAAVSAQIVDQSQLVNSGLAAYAVSGWNGQTFKPTANTSVGAGFGIKNLGAAYSGTMTIQLWTGVPATSTLLATGSTAFTIASGATSMVDVFWTAVSVTPGTQYFLAESGAPFGNVFSTQAGDLYAGGTGYYNPSASVTGSYSAVAGDRTFEEYSATPSAVTTPEPASATLIASGLVLVAARTRRRKKSQS